MTVPSFIPSRSRSKLFSLVIALAVGWPMLPAHAANLQLPSTNSINFNGTALSITNTSTTADTNAITGIESSASGAGVTGIANGPSGMGLLGKSTGANSNAIYGINSKSGFAGRFLLNGVSPSPISSALLAVDAGGSTSALGTYGNAGNFRITNTHNTAPAVSISTNGLDSYALKVVNSSFVDFAVTYPPSNNNGGIAGYFEITSPNAQFGQAAILAVHSGGETSVGGNGRFGNAGRFVITNNNNFDSAVNATTMADQGTAVEADDFSTNGGVAILGVSSHGTSAEFTGGSAGSGTCSYSGGPGWTCPSDRNLKEGFEPADLKQVLVSLDRMPVTYYRMKGQQPHTRYLGPTAQDFKAAFKLGDNDTTINTSDAQGVALAAAKGLYRKLKNDEATIAADHLQIAALEQELKAQKVAMEAAVLRFDAAVARLSVTQPVLQAYTGSR